MKKALFLISTLFLTFQLTYGQNYFERLYSIESLSSSNKHVMHVDSSFFFTGQSRSSSSKMGDLLLLKVNNNEEEFKKEFGSNDFDEGFDLLVDSNFVYVVGEVVVGDTFYQEDIVVPLTDIYLIKTKLNGDTVWTKKYNYNSLDRGCSIIKYNNSIVIAAISSNIDYGEIKLMYIDSMGIVSQTETIGGFPESNLKLMETKDSNLIILYNEGHPSNEAHILKLDKNGNNIWEYTVGSKCENIKELNNGGFIIIGSENRNVYVSKLSNEGIMNWEKSYDFTTYWGEAYGLEILTNDDFIVCGENILDNNFRTMNSFICKLTNEGDLIWHKEFGLGFKSFLTTVSTLKNGYYASGGLFKDNDWSVFVVKSDFDGNVDTTYIVTSVKEYSFVNDKLNVYPNPTKGVLNIDYLGTSSIKELIVYSLLGQELIRIEGKSIENGIQLNNLNQDLVILKALTYDKQVLLKKIVIHK